MGQTSLTQAVGQRISEFTLPKLYIQQTFPLHLPTQTPQRIQSVEKAQRKQSDPLKPQGRVLNCLIVNSYIYSFAVGCDLDESQLSIRSVLIILINRE